MNCSEPVARDIIYYKVNISLKKVISSVKDEDWHISRVCRRVPDGYERREREWKGFTREETGKQTGPNGAVYEGECKGEKTEGRRTTT